MERAPPRAHRFNPFVIIQRIHAGIVGEFEFWLKWKLVIGGPREILLLYNNEP